VFDYLLVDPLAKHKQEGHSMKKQPEVTQKTKRAFMDALCELYAHKPIERISVQEIANRAWYNRSSF